MGDFVVFFFVSVRAIHDYVINNFVIFFAFISTPMAEWFTVGVKKRFSRSFLHTLIHVLPARTSIDHCYVIVFVFKNNYFRNILVWFVYFLTNAIWRLIMWHHFGAISGKWLNLIEHVINELILVNNRPSSWPKLSAFFFSRLLIWNANQREEKKKPTKNSIRRITIWHGPQLLLIVVVCFDAYYNQKSFK